MRLKAALATVLVALVVMTGTLEAQSLPLIAPDPTDFFTLEPCRVIDTRAPAGPLGGPALVAGADRVFPVAGACGIPPGAKAISVNIAVTAASAPGNLRLHPGGSAVPLISSINYQAGQTRSNNTVVSLNDLGELAAFVGAANGTVHLILDVNGFFAPPPPPAPLTVTRNGNGGGTVTSSPAGINCGADCTELYILGTQVQLTATPSSGSTFAGWSGGGCSGTGTCVVTILAATTVTATFTLDTFSLTVAKGGNGAGTVTSSPAGINCGADCTENYSAGTVVTLTATPSTGSTFSGWGGACSGTGTCVVTMDAAKSVSATFTLGIFVSVAGANIANCGLVFTDPCQTISFGIVRAVQTGQPNVYVQAGTYNEVVVLLSGVNVWGGYDFNWQHGQYTNPANRVTVVGKQDTTAGGDGEYLTVRAHDLIVPVTIDDLVLQGPNAQGVGGVSGLDGRSSYVVHAKAAELSLTHVQVAAGNGASGATGSAGLDAVVVDVQSFMVGGNGGNGDEFNTACDSSLRGGGGGAAGNSCAASPSSRSMNAGGGGRGGTMDTSCSFPLTNLTARPGDNGGSAAFVFGSFGAAGSGGSGGDSCGPTTGGGPGLIANGGAGGANAGGYRGGTNNLYWYARSGSSGSTGENGSGGGGGGGGGGCDVGTDAYGGGAGGGGAGGCAARGGGGGGGGGGGSFGIFVIASSTVNLESCDLFRGVGGTGGAAGGGGRGQSGGGGGAPGANPGSALAGAGGNGAHGGHGGGGGGGQGGRSIGIVTDGSPINGTCTQSQGAGGGGGAGGVSAPNAPVSERDGANGGGGLAGTLEDLRVCSGSSC